MDPAEGGGKGSQVRGRRTEDGGPQAGQRSHGAGKGENRARISQGGNIALNIQNALP